MTDQETVEGGLDEPSRLEPEQGALDLAQPEDRHDRAEWEAAAAAVLRKARRLTDEDDDALVWDRLTKRTLDGIAVTPLGTPDDVAAPTTQGRPTRAGEWDIRAFAAAGEAEAVNEEVLTDLENGVTSLWLEIGPDTDLDALLNGVLLDLAPLVVAPTGDAVATAERVLKHLDVVHPGTNLGVPAAEATADLAAKATDAGVLAFVVDATAVHDRGASDAQELGWAMAAAAGYLRTLTGEGLSVADAAGLVEFRLAATDEQFPTIAKLRAARRLWARVQELSDSEPVPMRLHVVTSRPMMSSRDPWVNMLRTTVAAFAAGVGGADAVTVLPFDSPLGRPDAFGRRIARNTSSLLISESHLSRVADPAGGAYAVERLTDDLAVAAWEELGRIESEGAAAFDERVEATAAERDQQVATRKRPLTGLSEFPNLAEQLPERAAYDGWDGVRSYGAAFEALRDDPPATHVFLATLGSVAQHTARATFASNLLAAGGVDVDVAGATDGVDALAAAYDGQPVVCLAGADPTYDEWGEAAAAALRDAGATHVVVAGKPRDWADDAAALGVDALAFLTRTREALR